jgi:hypothetical protein
MQQLKLPCKDVSSSGNFSEQPPEGDLDFLSTVVAGELLLEEGERPLDLLRVMVDIARR